MKTGIEIINEERQRQISVEGWSLERDRQYVNNELSLAAAAYSIPESRREKKEEVIGIYDYKVLDVPEIWPWDQRWWKPTPDDRIRELAKAGALIAAEIDRLQVLKVKEDK